MDKSTPSDMSRKQEDIAVIASDKTRIQTEAKQKR